jgi:transposase
VSNKKKRRSFTPEFKAEAVELVRASGKSVAQIAKDLALTETSLREWVRASEREKAPAALSESERGELERLRRDVRVLRMERDLLKKAAAFFAKENT